MDDTKSQSHNDILKFSAILTELAGIRSRLKSLAQSTSGEGSARTRALQAAFRNYGTQAAQGIEDCAEQISQARTLLIEIHALSAPAADFT